MYERGSVLPLEETDPEIAELILDVANRRYSRFNVRHITAAMDLVPFLSIESIGRNDLCPCGSGLKYKKCCLDQIRVPVMRQA